MFMGMRHSRLKVFAVWYFTWLYVKLSTHGLVQAVMQAGSAGVTAEKGVQSAIAKTPMVSQSMPYLSCLYVESGGHLEHFLLLLLISARINVCKSGWCLMRGGV